MEKTKLANPAVVGLSGFVLIICALSAWYMMAVIVINDVTGRTLLKNGKAWISGTKLTVMPQSESKMAS